MKLDEMIIKANADGKTYFNTRDKVEYSAKYGFSKEDDLMYFDLWEEKPKRHLTVSEAEKELDCVIDVPDISELLRSPDEHPEEMDNVIVYLDHNTDSGYTGFYTHYCGWHIIGADGHCEVFQPLFWIDPADLRKFIPKE